MISSAAFQRVNPTGIGLRSQVEAALRGCFAFGRRGASVAAGRSLDFWLEGLKEAWLCSRRMDKGGLRIFERKLDAAFTAQEREWSAARFGGLADSLHGAWHLGMAGWLIRERNLGALSGHFLSLYAARAVEFHLAPVPVARGLVKWLDAEGALP